MINLITENEVIGACFETYETIILCNDFERLTQLATFCFHASNDAKEELMKEQYYRLFCLAEVRACDLCSSKKEIAPTSPDYETSEIAKLATVSILETSRD